MTSIVLYCLSSDLRLLKTLFAVKRLEHHLIWKLCWASINTNNLNKTWNENETNKSNGNKDEPYILFLFWHHKWSHYVELKHSNINWTMGKFMCSRRVSIYCYTRYVSFALLRYAPTSMYIYQNTNHILIQLLVCTINNMENV